MNVGVDMRLVNTNMLEVAEVISSQKQIIGQQISAGRLSVPRHEFLRCQRRILMRLDQVRRSHARTFG